MPRNLRLDHNASAQVLAPANNIHNPQSFAVYDTHDSMCSYVNTGMDAPEWFFKHTFCAHGACRLQEATGQNVLIKASAGWLL